MLGKSKCWERASVGTVLRPLGSRRDLAADAIGLLEAFNIRHVALMKASVLNRAECVFLCVRV